MHPSLEFSGTEYFLILLKTSTIKFDFSDGIHLVKTPNKERQRCQLQHKRGYKVREVYGLCG